MQKFYQSDFDGCKIFGMEDGIYKERFSPFELSRENCSKSTVGNKLYFSQIMPMEPVYIQKVDDTTFMIHQVDSDGKTLWAEFTPKGDLKKFLEELLKKFVA